MQQALVVSTKLMRPLFAIAPLALLLALFGPTPHEANQAIEAFKARFMAPKAPQQVERSHEASITKPSMLGFGGALNHLESKLEAPAAH
jgi:hypothetical protein